MEGSGKKEGGNPVDGRREDRSERWDELQEDGGSGRRVTPYPNSLLDHPDIRRKLESLMEERESPGIPGAQPRPSNLGDVDRSVQQVVHEQVLAHDPQSSRNVQPPSDVQSQRDGQRPRDVQPRQDPQSSSDVQISLRDVQPPPEFQRPRDIQPPQDPQSSSDVQPDLQSQGDVQPPQDSQSPSDARRPRKIQHPRNVQRPRDIQPQQDPQSSSDARRPRDIQPRQVPQLLRYVGPPEVPQPSRNVHTALRNLTARRQSRNTNADHSEPQEDNQVQNQLTFHYPVCSIASQLPNDTSGGSTAGRSRRYAGIIIDGLLPLAPPFTLNESPLLSKLSLQDHGFFSALFAQKYPPQDNKLATTGPQDSQHNKMVIRVEDLPTLDDRKYAETFIRLLESPDELVFTVPVPHQLTPESLSLEPNKPNDLSPPIPLSSLPPRTSTLRLQKSFRLYQKVKLYRDLLILYIPEVNRILHKFEELRSKTGMDLGFRRKTYALDTSRIIHCVVLRIPTWLKIAETVLDHVLLEVISHINSSTSKKSVQTIAGDTFDILMRSAKWIASGAALWHLNETHPYKLNLKFLEYEDEYFPMGGRMFQVFAGQFAVPAFTVWPHPKWKEHTKSILGFFFKDPTNVDLAYDYLNHIPPSLSQQ